MVGQVKVRSFAKEPSVKPFALLILLIGVGHVCAQEPTHLQSELYPLKVGTRWTYRVHDKKAPQTKADPMRNVVVAVEREEMYSENRLDKDGKAKLEKFVGYILKSTSGNKSTLDYVVVTRQGLLKVHTAGTPLTPPLLFLKLDIDKGQKTWDWLSTSGDTTIKGTFTLSTDTIRIPAAKEPVNAVLVSYRDHQPKEKQVEIDFWFVPGVGMVKQRVRERNHDIELELEKYEPAK